MEKKFVQLKLAFPNSSTIEQNYFVSGSLLISQIQVLANIEVCFQSQSLEYSQQETNETQ